MIIIPLMPPYLATSQRHLFRRRFLAVLTASVLAFIISGSTVLAQHPDYGAKMHTTSPGVAVTDAWARPPLTPTGAGAVYLTVVNNTRTADRLIGVKTSAAKRAQLHTHILTDGIARMRRVERISLKAGGTIIMKPGGFHVMLMRPNAALKEGTKFLLTLVFERAGEIEVQVLVRNATANDSRNRGHNSHGN